MRLAMLAMFAVALQDDTGEQFYKFPVGASWKLTEKEGDKESTIELKVVEHKDGKVHLESRQQKGEGEPRVQTLVWWADGGHLVWGQMDKEELRPELRFYKCGSKKGDTWEASAGKGGPPDAKATHMGTVEVKVPAGTYKDAVHVQMSFMGMNVNMYWAPKVGLVRMEREHDGKVAGSVELVEFKEGK